VSELDEAIARLEAAVARLEAAADVAARPFGDKEAGEIAVAVTGRIDAALAKLAQLLERED
jgi:hypothetical protein